MAPFWCRNSQVESQVKVREVTGINGGGGESVSGEGGGRKEVKGMRGDSGGRQRVIVITGDSGGG